ncbi:MAG: ribonuclease J [Clostridiaceae bacterium]|nr:ribonuclease J [Clostridiaceae bacterium]
MEAKKNNQNRRPRNQAANLRPQPQKQGGDAGKNTDEKKPAEKNQVVKKPIDKKPLDRKPMEKKEKSIQNSQKNPARAEKKGVPKLRIIPLGGLNEIGKNLTVFEYGEDIFIVDCGLTFPDDELLGVDLVIPDMTYLVKNKEKVRGVVLTHAHEDHIGALPYFLRDIKAPIYCTALTAGVISLKISEHKNLGKVKINVKKAGDHIKLGCFDIELIRVNHSIADAVALAIKTPVGMVVMTGDFKIDPTPIKGEMIDLERFGRLGREGVMLLMSDSTNAERQGFSMSERKVGESFDSYFKNCDRRMIVATFASNVDRIQQIINTAVKYKRKVAVSGRSMENILKVAMELGYIQVPDKTLIDLNQINRYPKEQLVVITTGSQGEPMSALYRMAFTGHRQIEVGKDDRIIISASPIPGNEKAISQMVNELFRRGADVVYNAIADVHVSGHACQEELKIILALVKPRYFMPVHGECRHLLIHASLAQASGLDSRNIIIGDLGSVVEFDGNTAVQSSTVQAGRVLVDGYGVGDVGAAVLRERKLLSEDGIIVAEAILNKELTAIISGPDIISRGFIYTKEAEELNEGMRRIAKNAIERCIVDIKLRDRNVIKNKLKEDLSEYLYKQIKRSPMVLPIITEIQ